MNSIAIDIYRDLDEVDVFRDLDGRALRVATDGLSWSALPSVDAIPQSQLLDFYYYMGLARAVDNEIIKLSRKGLAVGKHLQCVGNEATTVGACSALRQSDWVTLAIRDLAAFLVRGIPAVQILAQACGRVEGLTAGWDGSLHMGSRPARIVGLVSHLGTLVPIATGCSFAEKYRGTDNVVLAFVGDGTTSTGDFHEALNIASVLRLPIVVVIENNQWAFGTPNRLQFAIPTLALRALSYGKNVEGYWIDGTSVTAVYHTVHAALERARNDQTIAIIEAVSMRMQGHSAVDPFTTYIPPQQLSEWKQKDPIATFGNCLLGRKLASAEDLFGIDARIANEVNEAALTAERGFPPDARDIPSRVFVPCPIHPMELETPLSAGATMTYHSAIQEALKEEMDRDPNIFIIGEDVGISNGAFKITEGFSKRYDQIDWADYWKTTKPFPQRRVIDAPLAEAGFCGLALGAALSGLRPLVEFQYADFSSEAFKMIVNYAATETVRGMGPLPIVFRLPSGWAPHTSIYHSVNPESWYASTPGLKIVAPTTAFDAKGLLKAAIRDDNPVLFIEYKALYKQRPEKLPAELNLPVPQGDYVVPIGKARIAREGKHLSIITYGSQIVRALEAAHLLEVEDGASIEVIDLRTLVPYDATAVQHSVRKTGRCLVTCEAPRTGCFGNTIVAEVVQSSFDFLEGPVRLVAAADTPVPFATVLEAEHLPTSKKLVSAIREMLAH